VTLLFDENLSPRLVGLLADIYPGCTHVHSCGLGSASDADVWEFAKSGSFTIVSKDSDFEERSIIVGSPPKLIWIRAGNCSTKEIERILRAAQPAIERFIQNENESCLILCARATTE